MKKTTILFTLLIISIATIAQEYYWVYFTDKINTKFDPYSYFDSKAIERRQAQNISLYDISDYPINEDYKYSVNELADEYIGETRWFNAIAVTASEDAISQILEFDYVLKVVQIKSEPVYCEYEVKEDFDILFNTAYKDGIQPQLRAMQGEEFVKNNFDGKGIRIAVFDGGFPDVDTHDAFAHLRDNNQIIKTYNFPKKQEDVYGWNSHGTMVLSCIAGMDWNGNKMGLATGSTFLLARTEVNPEPAKEEVYWMMAVEWADKNGADVINSSLGYGADRHDPEDMDGESCLVTRAANMAASKGILVCNAMGNEGDDGSWVTLGAPADADSILTIGGVDQYTGYHIDFSSYGPTADGRMKPNVSAWGEANVAKPGNHYSSAFGTSFASPLAAGFVATAWQTNRDLSAMELKTEIEKSANLYPYYDYAVGYGVPQAGYFTGKNKTSPESVFELIENDNDIIIRVSDRDKYENILVLYHIENSDGTLVYYAQSEYWMSSGDEITIEKEALYGNKVLRVFSNGYMEEFKLENGEYEESDEYDDYDIYYPDYVETDEHFMIYEMDVEYDKASAFGVNSKFYIMPYVSLGFITPPFEGSLDYKVGKSRSFKYGLKYIHNITKVYRIGFSFDFSRDRCFYNQASIFSNITELDAYNQFKSINLEFFQRFRFVPGAMTGFGTYLDLGIYGSMIRAYSNNQYITYDTGLTNEIVMNYQDFNKWNWGLRAKLGHGILVIYGQYRITDINKSGNVRVPKLEVGLELNLPLINM